jgi:hypothetical protein
MENLQDLKMVLEAIVIARKRWLLALSGKSLEIMRGHPELNFQEALNKSLMHPEIHEQFQSLVNLYGIVGSNSGKYLEAIEDFKQVGYIKKAA